MTPLLVEQQGHVLKLTLNRAEKLNALSRDLQDAIREALLRARDDPSVRAIVLTGAGRAFCAGADVARLEASASGAGDALSLQLPRFTARQLGVYKPTICAVNGVCAGAGLHYVADSDIVIASSEATFFDPHVNVGQLAGLEPIGLLRRASLGTVLRMVLLGRTERLSARQALAAGLISEVVPPDQLDHRAMELGQTIASASPAAVQGALRAIWESFDHALTDAYDNAFALILAHKNHPDAVEGPRAFAARRAPRWQTGDVTSSQSEGDQAPTPRPSADRRGARPSETA